MLRLKKVSFQIETLNLLRTLRQVNNLQTKNISEIKINYSFIF